MLVLAPVTADLQSVARNGCGVDGKTAAMSSMRNRTETITTTTTSETENAAIRNAWQDLEDNPMAVRVTTVADEYGFQNCQQAVPRTAATDEKGVLSRKRPAPVPIDPMLYQNNMQQYRKRLKPL